MLAALYLIQFLARGSVWEPDTEIAMKREKHMENDIDSVVNPSINYIQYHQKLVLQTIPQWYVDVWFYLSTVWFVLY